MKTLTLNKYGNEYPMTFEVKNYSNNGNLYVGLITHHEGFPEPWQNLTINLNIPCKANCAFIDINNNGMQILDWLVDNGLGRILAREKVSGFCVYPEFEFDMEKLMEFAN